MRRKRWRPAGGTCVQERSLEDLKKMVAIRVASKVFRQIAQLQLPPPPWVTVRPRCRGPMGRGSRCEAARAAICFGGFTLAARGQDGLKCTTSMPAGPVAAPGTGRKQGAESSGSFSPLFPRGPFPFVRFPPLRSQPSQPRGQGNLKVAGAQAPTPSRG